MPLNIRELLSGMKSGREGGCSPDRRANPVDVRRFYCGDKKLVFMVWPIEIQFTTRVAALPATGRVRQRPSVIPVTFMARFSYRD